MKITTGSLSLSNGGTVSASSLGKGNAELVEITAKDTIAIDGEGSDGFPSGAFSQVFPGAEGDAGGVKITTVSLSLTNGGRVSASTLGKGNAELVEITAKDTIAIDGEGSDGFPSGAFSQVNLGADGNAGGVKITTVSLSLTNGGTVSASSFGRGDADDIFIRANSIALENGASLSALTSVNTGGNITLKIADNLTLLDNSTISAQATSDANGGNITIDADFIIASLNQPNNDIIARAEEGQGGNINITTEGVFGFEIRRANPPNNTNDIDASSELSGPIEINTPDVDLIQLPTQPLETEVTQACAPGSTQGQSEFFITGRGGLPPTPNETLSSDAIGVDLVTLDSDVVEKIGRHGDRETRRRGEDLDLTQRSYSQSQVSSQIIEVQGIIVDENGDVVLVASVPNTASPSSWQNQPQCDGK